MSCGHGNAFLAEVLAVELGLQHGWDLGNRRMVCASDCASVVEILQCRDDISTLWASDTLTRVSYDGLR